MRLLSNKDVNFTERFHVDTEVLLWSSITPDCHESCAKDAEAYLYSNEGDGVRFLSLAGQEKSQPLMAFPH